MSIRSMPPAPPPFDRNTPISAGDLVRRLDWRQELLAVLLVVAEAALVYLATGFLLPQADPGSSVLPAWIVVMLLLTAHLVPHLLDEWRVWSPTYETLMVVAISLSTLIAIQSGAFPQLAVWDPDWLRQTVNALAFLDHDARRPVWGIVALAVYAWWRGRTRSEGSIDSAYTMLRSGAVALAVLLLLILSAAPGEAQVRDRLSGATIAFFICALAAVGVARLKLEGFRTSAPLGPRWLATFVGPIVAVVVVAIIGAGIFSRQLLDTILWMLSPVFFILGLIFEAFVIALAIIAFILLSPLVWLIGDREPVAVPATPTAVTEPGPAGLGENAASPFQVPDPLRYLIAALILFAIVSLLTKFVFRRRRRERDSTDEERESVLEWGDMFGSLAARLRGVRRAPDEDDPLAHLRGDPRWRHTLTIRETYLRLQERGASAGRPRREPETADEYRPGIASRLATPADVPAAIATITEVYRRARYSGDPATEQDAARVLAAWKVVESAP